MCSTEEAKSDHERFTEAWKEAGPYGRAWVRAKARWEHVSAFSVFLSYGVPTEEQAKEWGIDEDDVRYYEEGPDGW